MTTLEEELNECKTYVSKRLSDMSERAYPTFFIGYSLYKRIEPTPICEYDIINRAFEDVLELEKTGYKDIPKWAYHVY